MRVNLRQKVLPFRQQRARAKGALGGVTCSRDNLPLASMALFGSWIGRSRLKALDSFQAL